MLEIHITKLTKRFFTGNLFKSVLYIILLIFVSVSYDLRQRK